MKRPFKTRKQKAAKNKKMTKFRLGSTKQQAHFFCNYEFLIFMDNPQ